MQVPLSTAKKRSGTKRTNNINISLKANFSLGLKKLINNG